MRTRLSYLLNPFLLATAVTNEIYSFLYINQFGSIILTISPEECQTKSFEMNLLLHAIFKFCTTKRLFEICSCEVTTVGG